MSKLVSKLRRSKLGTSLVAFVLAFSVLLSSFGLTIFAGVGTNNVWDGEAEALTVGTGTETDPYIISTAGQLYTVATMAKADTQGKYFELANDIYLNDVTSETWYENNGLREWTFAKVEGSAFNTDKAFAGHFNGKGHVVRGLYVSEKTNHTDVAIADTSVAAGIFPLLSGGATVTALGLENSFISISNSVEAVGVVNDVNTDLCTFGGFAGAIAGKIVGNSDSAPVVIDQCYANESAILKGYRIGLAGEADSNGAGVFVRNCYATMSYEAYRYNLESAQYDREESNRPALVASNTSSVTYTGCWTIYNLYGNNGAANAASTNNYRTGWVATAAGTTQITAEEMKGDLAKTKMSGLDWDNMWVATAGYPVLKVFVDAALEANRTWDGSIADALVGSGTETSPYLIRNGAELAHLVTKGESYADTDVFEITADIYLNDIEKVNWETGLASDGYTINSWFFEGSSTAPQKVRGIVKGNGHVIYGLYINSDKTKDENGTSAAGLFPVYGKLQVSGLGVENSYMNFNTNYSFGGIVGKGTSESNGNVIDQCYVGSTVTMKGYDVAGIIGGGDPYGTQHITVKNCYSRAKIDASHWGAGILADFWTAEYTIQNCYSVGSAIVVKEQGAQAFTNIYTDTTSSNLLQTVLPAGDMKDTYAKTAMAGLDFDTVFITVDNDYPDLRIFGRNSAEATPDTAQIWDGSVSASLAGSGTEAEPFLIKNGADLAYAVKNPVEGKFYKLTQDIYLNDTAAIDWTNGTVIDAAYAANEWLYSTTAEGTSYDGKVFKGTIDGNGKTIYGMYYKPGNFYTATGLLPAAADNTVKNLRIKDSFVSGGRWTSALIGYGTGVTLDQVIIDSSVTVWGYDAGGHYYTGGAIGWPFSGDAATNVHFFSEGVGAVIGYANGAFTATNIASYATVKFDGFTYTYQNANVAGGAAVPVTKNNHDGGLIGASWDTIITVTGAVSYAKPCDGQNGNGAINFTKVYTTATNTPANVAVTVVTDTQLRGAASETYLPDLDWTVWKATKGYPTLAQYFNPETGTPVPDEPGDDTIWDGSIATELEGSGTNADPYKITNGAELAYVIKNGSSANKHYIITQDIYLNDVEKMDWATGTPAAGYTPNAWFIGDSVQKFEGTINGNGKTVYGMYYKDTTAAGDRTTGAGLIPKAGKVSITGLGLDKAYYEFNTNYCFGALIGNGQYNGLNGVIDQCYVGAEVYLKGYDVGSIVGGGNIDNTGLTISNCIALANITASNKYGMIGDCWSADYTLTGNIVIGNKLMGNGTPNAASGMNYSTVDGQNAQFVTTLADADLKDTVAQEKMPTLDWDNIFITVDDNYPDLRIFGRHDTPATPDGGTPTPPPSQDTPETPADTAIDQLPIWDGTTMTKPNGAGTQADPYRISNAENLAWMVKNGSNGADAFYKFTNHILVNDVTAINWKTGEVIKDGYTPRTWITNPNSKIRGTIIGNNKVVYGIYVNDTSAHGGRVSGAGLFPLYGKVTLTALGLESSYIRYETNYGLGAMFGQASGASGTTVDKCYVSDTVTVKGYDASGMFGGGDLFGGTITAINTYVNALVQGSHWSGGFVADTWGSSYWVFKNCYTTSGNGIIGKNGQVLPSEGTENSYATAYASTGVELITADKIKDTKGQTAMPNLDWDNVFITKDDSYPVLRNFGHNTPATPDVVPDTPETPAGTPNEQLPIWDGVTLTRPNGQGTEADPYRISNGENLAYIVANGGEANAFYKLTNNIFLNATDKINFTSGKVLVTGYVPNEWFGSATPDGTNYNNKKFTGTVDGAGHTVYGMYYTPGSTLTATGLFPVSDNATVKNLRIKDAFVSGGRWTAAMSGMAYNMKVSDVIIDHTVTINGYNAGNKYFTTANYNADEKKVTSPYQGTVSNGTITTTRFESVGVAGIVGYAANSATIENVGCFATINISGFTYTTTNPAVNGGNPITVEGAGSKAGAFVGTGWNANITIKDSVSSFAPFKTNDGHFTLTDVYSPYGGARIQDDDTGSVTVVAPKKLTGALSGNFLTGLDFDSKWKATKGYPTLIQFYSVEEDVELPDTNPEPDQPVVWDGQTRTPPKGNGTKADPYRIASAANLAYILGNTYSENTHFIFVQDIYINDVEKIDWATGTPVSGYTPNKWFTTNDSAIFNGIVDGNGKTVYGMYYKDTTAHGDRTTGAGLFPKAWHFNISSLAIDKSYLEYYTNYSLGALIGNCTQVAGTVEEILIGAGVTVKGFDAGTILGGGDTEAAGITLKNCLSLGKAVYSHRGGMVGDCWTSEYTFDGCLAVGTKLLGNGAPSSTSGSNYATVESAGATLVDVAKIIGDKAAELMPNLDWEAAYATVTGKLPTLKRFTDYNASDYWNGGFIAPSKGTGTAADPFIISTAEELAYIVKNGSAAGVCYKLANDIYLNDLNKITWYSGTVQYGYTVREWLTSEDVAAPFAGNFDGNGYHIYGLYYGMDEVAAPSGTVGAGLFPVAGSGISITKLGVEKSYLEFYTNYALGTFIGNLPANAAGSITHSYVGDTVTLKGFDTGAFVGGGHRAVNFTIEDSYAHAVIDYSHRGGLIGDSWDNASASGKWVINRVYAAGTEIYQYEESAGIKIFGNNASALITNTYAAKGPASGITIVSIANMQGRSAIAEFMPGLGEGFRATDGFPVLMAFTPSDTYATDKNGVWTGKLPVAFSDDGKGTEDDPILIKYPGDLALAIASGGGGLYYKLTTDIYLNYANTKRWFEADGLNEWNKISGATFNGHIDGDGYCVYGLYISDSFNGNAGLIGHMEAGSVKNLGVRYAQIKSTGSCAGGIIGHQSGLVNVDSCFVDESVTIGAGIAGGIVGLAIRNNPNEDKGLVITNCYSKAPVKAPDSNKANGLIGSPWRSAYEIYNSYSVGIAPYMVMNDGTKSSAYWFFTDAVRENGEIVEEAISHKKDGKVASDYFKNIYSNVGVANNVDTFWTTVTSEGMHGDNALTAMPGLDYEKVWKTVQDGTPMLRVFEGRISGEDIDMSADSEVFTKGKGTRSEPYLIENAGQLLYLVQSTTTLGKYYALAKDIYVNETTKKNWMYDNATVWPVDNRDAAFAGTLDGMGYSIHGLYINEDPKTPEELGNDANYVGGKAAGLFAYLDTAGKVRNLHIRDSFISGAGSVGAIAGHMTGNASMAAEIIGCSIDETVTLRGFTVGGLVGAGDLAVDIYYSYCTGDLKNTGPADRINGFIGDIWGQKLKVANSYVKGYKILRGMVGFKLAVYTDTSCAAATNIVGTADMYGAIAKEKMPDLDWERVWYTANGKTPQLKYVGYDVRPVANDEGEKGRVWSGFVATKFAGGTGTEADPYLIETPEQMAMLLVNGGSNSSTYYKITADLKLNDTSKKGWEKDAKSWFTGCSFSGHLDGDGHIVTGLYYNTSDSSSCGFIPIIDANASVKRLGIATSTIINEKVNSGHTYAGALIGWLNNHDGYNGANMNPDVKPPVISECFVAQDVSLQGDTVGGLLGGGAAGIEFYDCYALPSLTYTYRGGGIFGDIWEGNETAVVFKNGYVSTPNRDPYGLGPKATEAITVLENAYIDGPGTASGKGEVKSTSLYFMRGDNAKENMPGLDYNKVWKLVKDGTPVLRCFENAEKYTCTREPAKVSINFTTGDDNIKYEAIYGYPMVTPVNVKDFPVPERYGYAFKGWSYFPEGDLMFDLELFPQYDIYVYAVWEKLGFQQGFEGDMVPEYDVNSGAQYFRPGIAGYNPRYIHGGLRSMQVMADSQEAPMFLLYYQYKLEIGQKYDITFYMTSRESGVAGEVQFVHANYADVNDETVGYEVATKFENLQGGVWKQYKTTITANAPYILVRTTPGVELYFDDFEVVPIGEEGKLGELEGFDPSKIDAEPGAGLPLVWIIIIICGGVVLLGGAAVLTIILVKKGKKAPLPPAQ